MRQLELDDCNHKYIAWLQDKEVTEFLDLNPEKINQNELENYVKNSYKSKSRINLAVLVDGEHIGNASIYREKSDAKDVFRTGWFIGNKKFWGSHTSTQIMFMLFDIGFLKFSFKSCIGSIRKSHISARMSNKFIGFSEILHRIEISKRHNIPFDIIDLKIDQIDWKKRRQELIATFPEKYKDLDINTINLDWSHYSAFFVQT